MNKKISKFLTMLCVAGIAMSYTTVAQAAQDSFVISEYSESFIPTDDKNATLNIEMKETTATDGLIYIPVSVADSQLISATVNGEEVSGETTKIGSISYFVLDAEVPEAEVNVSAEISCPDFYSVEYSDPDTGIPTPKMTYKFVNKGTGKIDSYKLSIALPEGMEPMSITTPKDVTKYTLGMNEKGQRTLSLNSSVAVSGNASFEFTFGKPFISNTISKVILWVFVIGISAYVLINRLKEEK